MPAIGRRHSVVSDMSFQSIDNQTSPSTAGVHEIHVTPVAASVTYPSEREVDVALRDGSTVHIRPVCPSDETAMRAFLQGVSRDSIGFRFFGAPDLNWVTAWSLDVDYADRFGLVAETGSPGQIVAHASYVRIDERRAEVAFLVADVWQGRGISTVMLAHLAAVADARGITTFTAQVLPVNHRMIDVFRQSGFRSSVTAPGTRSRSSCRPRCRRRRSSALRNASGPRRSRR
jgi:RimJ/RimL family protein N-acetyltransferase